MDRTRKETDRLLRKMEQRLSKIYSRAHHEMQEKWANYLKEFEPKANALQKAIKAAQTDEEIAKAKKAYQDFLREKTLKDKFYRNLTQQIATDYTHVNQTAVAYINNQLPQIYAINYNGIGKEFETHIKGYSFELVDPSTVRNLARENKTLLPYKKIDGRKDVRWNTRKVNSEMLQGILQGESIPDIAKRLQNVTSMNEASSIRNARTACTSAENKGRMDSYHDAEEKGVVFRKYWIATNDGRTRDSHLELDGVEAEIDEPFKNSIGEIMYPGDPNADPENVYNCRCSLGTRIVGFRKGDGSISYV